MSKTLRTGERFLKKLAVVLDGIIKEMGRMKDGESKREAYNALGEIRLCFCKLTKEAMKEEELAGEIFLTLRELVEERSDCSKRETARNIHQNTRKDRRTGCRPEGPSGSLDLSLSYFFVFSVKVRRRESLDSTSFKSVSNLPYPPTL